MSLCAVWYMVCVSLSLSLSLSLCRLSLSLPSRVSLVSLSKFIFTSPDSMRESLVSFVLLFCAVWFFLSQSVSHTSLLLPLSSFLLCLSYLTLTLSLRPLSYSVSHTPPLLCLSYLCLSHPSLIVSSVPYLGAVSCVVGLSLSLCLWCVSVTDATWYVCGISRWVCLWCLSLSVSVVSLAWCLSRGVSLLVFRLYGVFGVPHSSLSGVSPCSVVGLSLSTRPCRGLVSRGKRLAERDRPPTRETHQRHWRD